MGDEGGGRGGGGKGLELITHFLLLPKLRICGAILLLPLCLHDVKKHNSNTEWPVMRLSYGGAGAMNIIGLMGILKKECFFRQNLPNTYVQRI
jgi:hypothetical protein